MKNMCYNGRLTKVHGLSKSLCLTNGRAKEAPEIAVNYCRGPLAFPLTFKAKHRHRPEYSWGPLGRETLTAGNDRLANPAKAGLLPASVRGSRWTLRRSASPNTP
jgi:hypothetical protein